MVLRDCLDVLLKGEILLLVSELYSVRSLCQHSKIFWKLIMTSMFVDPCIIVQFIKKNSTRCNNVSTFYYSIFIGSSTRFGRLTAHHQEPKTELFFHTSKVFGRVVGGLCQAQYEKVQSAFRPVRPDSVQQLHVQQPSTHAKPEAASAVLGS